MSHGIRICILIAALVGALANGSPDVFGDEIQPGDWVVTTAARTPVKAKRDVLFVLGKQTELRAENVNGDWIAVTVMQGKRRIRGWVQAKHLTRIARNCQDDDCPQNVLASLRPEEKYIAFSLVVAQKRHERPVPSSGSAGSDGISAAAKALRSAFSAGEIDEKHEASSSSLYDREQGLEVLRLGGMTRIHGLVLDPKTGDAIVVGQYVPGRAALTLDDLVVALRARLVRNEWPAVSIDPPKKRDARRKHTVRFEGGVDNTPFGQTLFDADYLLKRISLKKISSGVPEVKSHWALASQYASKSRAKSRSVFNRFWFYPIASSVAVRENVAAIRGLEMGVHRELMGAKINGKTIDDLSKFKDQAAEEFVAQLREHYDELAVMHPSFRRLQQLNELVALTHSVQSMKPQPDLSWWLDHYRIQSRRTPTTVDELSQQETVSSSYGYTRRHTMSGGVQLRALARRVKAGDACALRDAVLKTRPGSDALCWEFAVADWVVSLPTTTSSASSRDAIQQFMYAQFLVRQKHYDEALSCLDKILRKDPDFLDALYFKGKVLSHYRKQHEDAIQCFDTLLEEDPDNAEAYTARGLVHLGRSDLYRAGKDFDEALRRNPKLAGALAMRGLCRAGRRDYEEALEDVNEALRLNPGLATAYAVRGRVYRLQGETSKALAELDTALRINPDAIAAHSERGLIHEEQKDFEQAVRDYSEILRVDPRKSAAHYRRARMYEWQEEYSKAIEDYSKLIGVAGASNDAYSHRGELYRKTRQFDNALSDSAKAGLLLFVDVGAKKATLKSGNKTVGTVGRGEGLQVLDVKDRWLLVEAVGAGGDEVRGWIDQKHVR